jgi:RNA polymerase sigma factor (sigma-70 family)
MSDDEAKLVANAQKGNRAALASVLKRYERGLYSSALVVLRSSWDAQDAVQETLYEACAKIVSLRDPAKLNAWLSTILVRKCYDLLRRRTPVLEAAEMREQQAYVFVGTERDDEVLQAVAHLPQEQRLAIVLRFFQDLSYRDIEAATGWPAGTVKSRINRAVARLRVTLGERSVGHEV